MLAGAFGVLLYNTIDFVSISSTSKDDTVWLGHQDIPIRDIINLQVFEVCRFSMPFSKTRC